MIRNNHMSYEFKSSGDYDWHFRVLTPEEMERKIREMELDPCDESEWT
tara:strand:- start:35 stop:178 length:144 start_codon:yes stop_codon:yes gene_type:complete